MKVIESVRRTANELIPAFKEACPENEAGPIDYIKGAGFRRAPSNRNYYLNAACLDSLEKAVEKISPLTGTYPRQFLHEKFKDLVIAAKDAGTPIEGAFEEIRRRLHTFLDEVTTLGTWEVLHGVRGVQPEPEPFSVGLCTFQRMDNESFFKWGQRFATGKCEPPPNAAVPASWFDQEGMLVGQVVAIAKVKAADEQHAETEGRRVIEEALNLLRYGQITIGWPPEPVPELGLTAMWANGFVQRHSLSVRLDGFGMSTNKCIPAGAGATLSYCRQAPAWSLIEPLLSIPPDDRSELQRRIMIALEWAGQAALASFDSLRVVALTTALEALLMQDHESFGKKSKLAERIPKFPQLPTARCHIDATLVEHLYSVRSGCLHAGTTLVPKSDERLANMALAQCLYGLLHDSRLAVCKTLKEVIDVICP